MTLQERLAMTQGQDNGMDIILGGIPAAGAAASGNGAAAQEQPHLQGADGQPPLHGTGGQHPQQRHSDAAAGAA